VVPIFRFGYFVNEELSVQGVDEMML